MKFGVIYLASGYAKRFGSNKLFYELDGKRIYQYGMQLMLDLKLKSDIALDLIVVSQYPYILEDASVHGMKAVENKQSEQGITASIHLGLDAMDEDCTHSLFFVADQPFMKMETMERFLCSYQQSGLGIGCVCSQGELGNPAIFAKEYETELRMLKKDRGGKQVIKQHLDQLFQYEVDRRELSDIDTPNDLGIIQS